VTKIFIYLNFELQNLDFLTKISITDEQGFDQTFAFGFEIFHKFFHEKNPPKIGTLYNEVKLFKWPSIFRSQEMADPPRRAVA